MFEKNIEFIASKEYIKFTDNSLYPEPASKNVPEWYKKLSNNLNINTVKQCMPFLDTLTSGYILKMPYDLQISHNTINPATQQKDAFEKTNHTAWSDIAKKYSINLPTGPSFHPTSQVEGSPLARKNKNLPFHKIMNPWKIKTPSGYSCLFVPPLNNQDDRFSIIPGIVDTDVHTIEVNFPFVVNGDKYPELETMIKLGTPYVQVIPFKREEWKMSIKPVNSEVMEKNKFNFFLNLAQFYKKNKWSKKKFK